MGRGARGSAGSPRAALARLALIAALAAPAATAVQDAPAAPVAPAAQDGEYVPFIEPASGEAAARLPELHPADGLAVELWAAEPLLANPVCLALDARGRVFVAETFRVHAGVTDIRDHMDWLDDDLACETVADRVVMYRKWLGADVGSYAREHDRVRLLEDTDGDGTADRASVFADGFSRLEDGIGSGLLARRAPGGGTDVFFTGIPDLWRLTDADDDGRAETRDVLSTGWGVRVAFLGHDMHGLRLGPDGRLYWSIGDRGFSVTTREGGLLRHTDTGAVLRCELDGSHLEVVHVGLRNPQELAFDDRGDLFTGDNNCDAGDLARFVPIVEGGDSGWRQPGQWLSDRGPWGREKLWAARFDGQPAWIIPPIANIASGPSGLTHEPGTALPGFAGSFLLCDFTGGADSSHVWAFPVTSAGAFYALGEVRDLLAGVLCTDADFGPDGALYVSDWVAGWKGTGKGRIWRVSDPAHRADPLVAETAALLAEGMETREVGALEALLGHADQRVRQEAQLQLLTRGVPGLDALERAVRHGRGLARLHGVWGLGIAARRDGAAFARLAGLDQDDDAEVRAQLFAVLESPWRGDWPAWTAEALARGVRDDAPRVVARAALAAGRWGRAQHAATARGAPTGAGPAASTAVAEALWDAVLRADPQDPVLRHALACGLGGCVPAADLADRALDVARASRLHAVLALRQQRSPQLVAFLHDADVSVATEAARAIHDVPVPEALAALAGCLATLPPAGEDAGLPAAREGGPEAHDDTDAFVRRVLNANDRLGTPDAARALAAFAARADQRPAHRAWALTMLSEWKESPARDRVHGFHQAVVTRPDAPLAELARELHAAGLASAEPELARPWVALVAASGAADLVPALTALLDDESADLDVRIEALQALATLRPPELPAIVDRTLSARDARLRAEALGALEALSPEQALPRLPVLLETGELAEQRVAYQILGRAAAPVGASPATGVAAALLPGATGAGAAAGTPTPASGDEAEEAGGPVDPEALLAAHLDRALAGLQAAELQLDLVLAAEARHDPRLDERLARLRAPRLADPDLAPFVDGLFGGDPERGRAVFQSSALSCQKCHATDEWGTQVVGPNLRGVGQRLTRLSLLQSIVSPNARTAPGYGSELLFLRAPAPGQEATTLSGRVTAERDGQLCVVQHDGRQLWVPAADVELRKPGLSPMPEGLGASITREQMRDLLEYLARLPG